MNDLMEFLSSKEVIIVYIVAALACLICFIIYIVEKYNGNLRKKHNTKELNKLVEKIKEEYPEEHKEEVIYNEPILEKITLEESSEANNIVDDIEILDDDVEKVINQENIEVPKVEEEVNIEPMDIVYEESEPEEEEEELQYTTIEPDRETAKLELQRITEELIRKEEEERLEAERIANENVEVLEPVPSTEVETKITVVEENTDVPQIIAEIPVENIELTSYEKKQEENAIISLEELVSKGKQIYEENELTQYSDEGNEPISIKDLEETQEIKPATFDDNPFDIEEVVTNVVEEPKIISTIEEVEDTSKKFKNSPIISPIFGIESDGSSNSLELENTANYKKLDDEIKKTNEFLMTLKELQSKLD